MVYEIFINQHNNTLFLAAASEKLVNLLKLYYESKVLFSLAYCVGFSYDVTGFQGIDIE